MLGLSVRFEVTHTKICYETEKVNLALQLGPKVDAGKLCNSAVNFNQYRVCSLQLFVLYF